MFRSLLNADEKTLFRQIVQSDAIAKELGIAANDQLFKAGYWGQFGGTTPLFRDGKIVALAAADKTVHDCSSTANTPGVDKKKCGKSVPGAKITVGAWLKSIGTATKDALSPPHRGSSSMGKGTVRTRGEEKGLAVFETRGYKAPRIRRQPASGWIDFAEDIFRQAAVCRPGRVAELS